MEPRDIHNTHPPRLMTEIGNLCGHNIPQINVMIESLLFGAAMFNFPHDPRRQALIIQEIADAAADRAARNAVPPKEVG